MEYTINKAGAKVYNDVKKHELLSIPVLLNENDKGTIYTVLSVGILGGQRDAIVTIKSSKNEIVAYRLPDDLNGWVQNLMLMSMNGVKVLPAEVEFGNLNGRVYAEIE